MTVTEMAGGAVTVKVAPLLATLFTVTITVAFPAARAVGTNTEMPVVLQLPGVTTIPLKVTVLLPWGAPKLVPAMVTDVPTGPEAGMRLVMFGGGRTAAEADLNAATAEPQLAFVDRVAVAAAPPAVA